MNPIDRFKAMLEAGQDNALLRLTLGNAYLAQGQAADAVLHLRAAVTQDPHYSAAWKALGKALEDTQALADASDAYAQGVAVAQQRGDLQAAREMQVFHKRVLKKLEQEPPTNA
ncbi:Tetratricopeptide repeat-containing protein [Ectothiorhodosinus mongolicus]|uniref:Tetratricopeptide repeat-containing protein n=1 Tax=Ectothiorhodosinus mongolicus TaxID=233100 RepID=A0A1R3VXB3_9GAMM|nr:tetratricopeptide repeat protein [Ectothiorhodosinus mongolicus]ULX57073.1 hypothetical protein CKX93_04820 [Ectothiorhodosinus mongolicus]SIT69782.1 Tetratricopeptide repeat-containing protein [Ectothiorhodosinus mongolicus]